MVKNSKTILIKLEGEDFEKYCVVSKKTGIKTGKDLIRHLIFEEYARHQ